MLQPLASSPDLVDQVYQAILDGICTGTLAPGERFTQEALAARLGVSRQPVLQALLLLRRQGLVRDTDTRRGVVVAALDGQFVEHLYAVRAALDGAAARGATLRSGATLADAGRMLIDRGRAAARDDSREALARLDLEFHLLLYEASGNPLLIESARLNAHHTRRVVAAFLRERPLPAESIWDEHAGILEAVLAGDADRAERLSRDHAEHAAQMLQARLLPEPGPVSTSTPDTRSVRSTRAAEASGAPSSPFPRRRNTP